MTTPEKCRDTRLDASRLALISRLEDEQAYDLATRLEKCGQDLPLLCTNCGLVHVARTRCDQKWCPSCQPRLAARVVARYAPIARKAQWPLFVTFTAKNWDDDGPVIGVREMRRAFTRFRRLRWWRKCVRGGVASLELTHSGHGYHPHIHALLDARWLSATVPCPRVGATREQWQRAGRQAAQEVGQQWELCLGRPASVKVRRVFGLDQGDIEPAIREVLKYSVKGSELAESKVPVAPMLRELMQTRMLVSWGSFYRDPDLKVPKLPPLACACGATGCYMPEQFAIAMARG